MKRITREQCLARDRADPLAGSRAAFTLPDGIIYLDGNSLGPLTSGVAERVAATITDEWGGDLIKSWNAHDWISLPRRVGARIATLIGAGGDEVIAADTTSVNLFKLVAAALRLRPGRRVIVSERGNFPTDIYILEGLIELLGNRHQLRLAEPGEILDAIDDQVAIVVLTHVSYRSGRILDMAGITGAARQAGALMLWDLCHTAGALPVDLGACGVDLAVGCGYKFLNGGPGAPAFLYVAKRLQADVRQPLTGWLGHAAPFAFDDHYRPAEGIERNLCGTPGVLGLVALDASLELLSRVDLAAVREKSMALGDLFIELMARECGDFGFDLACPDDSRQRASQVSFRHAQGHAIMQALIARGVIGDFRAPDILRFGLAPLYIRHVDIWDAVATLKAIMTERSWDQPAFHARRTVT